MQKHYYLFFFMFYGMGISSGFASEENFVSFPSTLPSSSSEVEVNTQIGTEEASEISNAIDRQSEPATKIPTATEIVKAAINYWRDDSSYSIANMTIHRPDWERTMTLRVWTLGMKNSLVRVLEPPKDKGNATLITNEKMWSFSPKTHRVINIPSSMMSQSWMGSDFSNNDVAKADSLLKYYTHKLIGTETVNNQTIYIVESIPVEDAPVVWGKEVVKIRADFIVLEHAFYDQDQILVKKMVTLDIQEMDGKLIATKQRMSKTETPNKWTEITVKEANFKITIPRPTFTLSNLSNPRN